MMIDFALVRRRDGLDALTAIREAALIRFRPIIMTTFAAILGAVPIALGVGAGAELRQPLGVAVVGGLCVSQLLTFVHYAGRLFLSRQGRQFPRRPFATCECSHSPGARTSCRRRRNRPGALGVPVLPWLTAPLPSDRPIFAVFAVASCRGSAVGRVCDTPRAA